RGCRYRGDRGEQHAHSAQGERASAGAAALQRAAQHHASQRAGPAQLPPHTHARADSHTHTHTHSDHTTHTHTHPPTHTHTHTTTHTHTHTHTPTPCAFES